MSNTRAKGRNNAAHSAAVEPSGLRLTKSDTTKLRAEWNRLVKFLRTEANTLTLWGTIARLHAIHKLLRRESADNDNSLREFVNKLEREINVDGSTLYRWIERSKSLVRLLGEDRVDDLKTSIVANDVRFLIKLPELESKAKALDIIRVYTHGEGKKAATKMLARAIHAEALAGLKSAETIGSTVGGGDGDKYRDVVLYGDALARLAELPDNHVQCAVTSIPFYNVRDYGTRSWIGGKTTCAHAPREDDPKTCLVCGAWHGQLGLEPTVDLFTAHMVAIFRETRRVLRDDGVVWMEVDDSYSGSGRGPTGFTGRGNHSERQGFKAGWARRESSMAGVTAPELPPKNLVLVPERLIMALQADGWVVRNKIVWAKTTCLGEAVTDRLSHSHSTIYVLTKSPTYFFDPVPIMEPSVTQKPRGAGGHKVAGGARHAPKFKRSYHDATNKYGVTVRYPRDIWVGPAGHYPGSHTATFPEWLPEKCVLASTSERGACKLCGGPWARVLYKPEPIGKAPSGTKYKTGSASASRRAGSQAMRGKAKYERGDRFAGKPTQRDDVLPAPETVGWEPSCHCGCKDVVPCVVLDMFGGTGTTLAVAMKHGRDYVGIELNETDYRPLIEQRLAEAKNEVERQRDAAASEVARIVRLANSGKR